MAIGGVAAAAKHSGNVLKVLVRFCAS